MVTVQKSYSVSELISNPVQLIFMCLACFTVFLFVPLITLGYRFGKQAKESPNKPEDYEFPQLSDLKMTVIATVVFAVMEYGCRNLFYVMFEPYCREQKDLVLRHKRSSKASFCIYKALYFMWATAFGYIVLKDTPYLPWYLGGSGDVDLAC